MTSSNSPHVATEPPLKRQKLSSPRSTIITAVEATAEHVAGEDFDKKMDEPKIQTQIVISGNGFQPEREEAVGILHFVNTTNPGFSGTLKQRHVFEDVHQVDP